jgi:uncharacterized membrane protein
VFDFARRPRYGGIAFTGDDPMTETGAAPSLMGPNKSNLQLIYILYLLFFFAGITAVIGVVIAYVAKPEAEPWLNTHYDFAIRTFWIGLLGSFVAFVLMLTILFIPAAALLSLLLAIWWIVRCIQGLDYLGKGQPIPKPQSWMFAA